MDKTKYQIERRYIDKRPNVRPGTRLTSGSPVFFVAHDTGNPGATADNHFTYFQGLKDRSASAQVFIDDKKILEIIPTGTGPDPAEKAWHVLYNVTTDNERFGANSNDVALGIEFCYGGKINFAEAYKRFVWYLAFCCDRWNKNPMTFIPTHKQLDPARKSDCDQGLKYGGKTLKDLLYDVAAEIACTPVEIPKTFPLARDTATELIDKYVSPAWFASHTAADTVSTTHFHNLADNLRKAAGIPLSPGAKPEPIQQLFKSNTQEIIFRWLSPAWFSAKAAGDQESMKYFNNQANQLRAAAGIPVA